MLEKKISVRVASVHRETPHVAAISLVSGKGEPLPPFEPGAHVDLHLGNGLVRSYSLAGSPADRSRYAIGVLHDRNSRGGSRFVHENFAPGHMLEISSPRNNFPLEESAAVSVFVAGGIGITPILPMAGRMRDLNRKTKILYACRSRSEAAFLNEVRAVQPAASLHFDDEAGGRVDLRHYMASQAADAHFYCCGPMPMLDAFESIGRELGLQNLHLERFTAAAPIIGSSKSFEVELRRSGKRYLIAEDKSILQTLLEDGLDLAYNCQAGICGACETGVLQGKPEHLDFVLGEEEKANNDRMMICVSRSQCAKLVLDL